MFWEVGLLVISLAGAISASDMPKEDGINAAGVLIDTTGQLRKLDGAGMPINNTDSLKMSEEAFDFHNGNSLEERRGCFPTLSCTRAGGYCIRPQADCNGTVDTQGCRRGRRCKCCIPDQTTSAPLTCLTTESIHTCPAVTPCSTSEIPTTNIPTTNEIPTTGLPTSDLPITTAIPTTIIITTEGSTSDPNHSWTRVGSDRFVRLPHKPSTNWFAARALCQAQGLDLYEPKDSKSVAIYLEDNFSSPKWYWVGAKGNGVSQIWLSGGSVPRSAPWYPDYHTKVATTDCMEIISHSGIARKNEVLAPIPCTNTGNNNGVICG